MILIFSIFIIFLWLLFGSFSSVLISRWHWNEWGIICGRSKCPHCQHTLSWKDLFPLISYALSRGKCRYCTVKISIFYPSIEIFFAVLFFILSYKYLYNSPDMLFSSEHIIVLTLGWITGVYMVSDLRFMTIPDEILVPGIYGYIFLLIFSVMIPSMKSLFFDFSSYWDVSAFYTSHIWWAITLYTFLFLQIFLPWGFFLIKKRRLREFFSLLFAYFTFPVYIVLDFFRKTSTTEDETQLPAWVWGGDLRIALFIGLTLGLVHGIIAFFIAYIFGSIVGLFLLAKKQQWSSHQIPFGPFLGLGWIIALIYHTEILVVLEMLA